MCLWSSKTLSAVFQTAAIGWSHRLHSVQAILVSAGKHGMSGYRLVLLEYLDRMNTITQVVFFNFLLSMEE